MNGVLPFAPLNAMSMLHDYVEPNQRWVALSEQDVVYGGGIAVSMRQPVVLQVPDFGSRFWVYQIVDLRTDSFASLGRCTASRPASTSSAGPSLERRCSERITKIFREKTGTAFVVPRVFMDDTDEGDRRAIRTVISGIDA